MGTKFTIIILWILIALWAVGCAPSHAGRTIGKGVVQVEGSLGGPMVTNLGGAVPVPNIPFGFRYGVTDRLDTSAHINLLPLAIGGFLVLDSALTFGLLKQQGNKGVNLATSTGVAFLTDFDNGARISALVDMAVSYSIKWATPFIGFEAIVDFWGVRVITNPFVGLELDISKWSVSAAAVWFNPGYNWYASAVRWNTENYQGSIGFLIGLKRKLKKKEERGRP